MFSFSERAPCEFIPERRTNFEMPGEQSYSNGLPQPAGNRDSDVSGRKGPLAAPD